MVMTKQSIKKESIVSITYCCSTSYYIMVKRHFPTSELYNNEVVLLLLIYSYIFMKICSIKLIS